MRLHCLCLLLATAHVTGNDVRSLQPAQGAASLVFVFDVTGSMYDDLLQVIEGASRILATTLSRREQPLHDYVLVPFRDPEIGPVTVTTDADEFEDQLTYLYVQGGGDCPEVSIGAIQKALEVSLPRSYIYVFTDARAKDYHLTDKVIELIQRKESQVVFVMTGDCGDNTHEGFLSYLKIASTSSGQVFLLKKHQVDEVLNFVKIAINTRKVNLLAIDYEKPSKTIYTLPVDSHLREFTVSLSGEQPFISITDPNGNMPSPSQFTELLRLRNVLIVNVKDPQPGNWTFDISSSSSHTLRVTGISTLDFTQRFGVGEVVDFDAAYGRPVAGLPMMSYINGTGVVDGVIFHQLDLISLDGQILQSLPLHYIDHSSLYNTSFTMPPPGFFYLQVSGTDEKGFKFIRNSKSAISAVIPASPVVTTAPRVLGHYGESINLLCIVDSLVPYTVTWYKGDNRISEDYYFLQTETIIHTLDNLTLADEASYSCKATSDAGSGEGVVFLDVTDPPPYIHPTLNVTVAPGSRAILDCVVESSVEHVTRWSRISAHSGRYIPLPPQNMLKNGSLLIRGVEQYSEGWYVCEAENVGGITSQRTFLKVGEAPVARLKPREVDFVAGGEMRLKCSASGNPPPTFSWRRRGSSPLISGGRVEVKDNQLIITDMTRSDAGIYECTAINIAGEDVAVSAVRYNEKPFIRLERDSILVAKGDSAALVCQADGIPSPTITWFKDGKEINERNAFVRVTSSGELMLLGAQPEDAADYTCVAKNAAGADQAVIRLEVGSVPVISTPPRSGQVGIGTSYMLPCVAKGYPEPAISWTKDSRPLEGDRVTIYSNNSIGIREMGLDDEGTYICSATNQFGSNEASASLLVTGIVSPVIAFMSPLMELTQGETLTLKCTVVMGNPMPTLRWYKDGKVISTSADRTLISPTGTLTVTDIEVADEGEYMCKAANIGGTAMMHTRLDVRVPPMIEGSGVVHKVYRLQGTSVNIPCVYSGDPTPEVMWTKNGNPISLTDQHYFINENNSLEIFVTNTDDTAQYDCTARNSVGDDTKTVSLVIRVKPKIARSGGQNIETVTEGDQLILPCEVVAYPPPTIIWTHNGEVMEVVKPGYQLLDSGAYKITKIVSGDGGLWTCIATNVVGNTTKSIRVKVNVPPEITDFGPVEYTVVSGDPVTLRCQAAGTPPPVVQWRKNNNFLTTKDFANGVAIMADGSLRLSSASIGDEGLYSCVATNDAGRATKSIKLTVHEPPTWPTDFQPKNVSVIQGQSERLLCPAQGFPPPDIAWYKDGVQLTGNELGVTINADGSLDLALAQVTDSGRYTCRAVNDAGDLSVNIHFSVYVPPSFTVNGEDPTTWGEEVKAVENSTLTLRCPAEAVPPPAITWYRDGVQLVLDDSRMVLSQGGQQLVVNGVQVSDEGRYKCVATNIAGEKEKVTDVAVYVPPKIKDHPDSSKENMTTIAGRNLFIECSTAGTPLPEINWFKDSKPLKSTDEVRILDGGRRLHLTNPVTSDEGLYTCVADNAAGTANKSFRINVYVVPDIEDSEEVSTNEVIRGKTIQLVCPATGVPPPKVTWTRSGQLVDPNLYPISSNGSILTIPLADLADRGRYVCRAENEAGEKEKTFDLSVLIPPSIDLSATTTNVSVVENQTATLTCAADGDPYPEVLWLFRNELLDSSTRSLTEISSRGRQLKLHNVQLTDEGLYTCLATNKAGDEKVNITLNVLIPPTIPTVGLKLNTTVVRGLRTAVDCPAKGKPVPSIKWYKDGEEMNVAQNPYYGLVNNGRRLIIANATLADTAVYTCRAHNAAGRSELRHYLTVYDPPTIEDSEIVSPLEVLINNSISIDCNTEGIPRPEVTWLSNGQPLSAIGRQWRLSRGGHTLTLTRADLSHTARYTCISTNEAGSADKDFDLDVLVPPYIDDTNIETEIRIIKGRQLNLNCPAMGTPYPDIKWYRNGFSLEDVSGGDDLSTVTLLSSNRQLSILSIGVDDTGTYMCQARNIAGQASLRFNVFVLVPPTIDDSNIVTRPRVRQNNTVIIECPARGIPDPTVKFLKNGRGIDEFPHITFESEAKRIVIDSAQVSDTGRYTCIATNEAGEARRTYDLQILVPARINRDGLETDLSVVENRTRVISCPVTGIPQPSVIWFRGRVPLIDGPYPYMRLLNRDQQLELSNVQLADADTYSCKATNAAGRDRQEFHLQVYLPPDFDEDTTPKTTRFVSILKNAFSLSCPVEGEPQPLVNWYKDGIAISRENLQYRISFDGQLLDIISVEVEDGGRFTCEAVNPAGKISRDFVLTVHVPSSIPNADEISELTVIVGNPTTLDCPVAGIPPPRVTWFKDGERLDPRGSSNIRLLANGQQLVVVDAQLLDIGSYLCVATNAAGNDSKAFIIDVQVPPSIEDPGNQFVAATDKTRTLLLCETYGLPAPTITWYKDGVEIHPEANPRYRMLQSGSLEFSMVKPSDTGNYSCVAENEAGSSNKSLTLSIQVIPEHLDPYQEVSVRNGENVALTCQVVGTPAPRLIWQIGTRIVANFPPERRNKSLIIEGASSSDSGTYICIAQNPAGTSTGRVKLQVLVKPTIDSVRELYRVIEGRELQLPCLTQGVPKPKITWAKDGESIDSDDFRFRVLYDGRLAIPLIRSEDDGVYTCQAVNEAGVAYHDVRVKVLVGARIVDSERFVTAVQGSVARLVCEVEGIPLPSISWHRNSVLIKSGGRFEVSGDGTLTINGVKASDHMNYKCEAINEAGQDSVEIALRVHVPPKIIVAPSPVEVKKGDRIYMRCEAEGVPTPSIVWKLNGTLIPSPLTQNGKSNLIVEQARVTDTGTYMCIAENAAGIVRQIATAKVNVPPRLVVAPGNTAVTLSDRVVLDCAVQGTPTPQVIWTKDGSPIVQSNRIEKLDNGSLIIKNTISEDGGEYKCLATNDAGTSEAGARLDIWSAPSFTIEPPDSVTVKLGQNKVIDCQVDGNPVPTVSWRRTWMNTSASDVNDRISQLPNNSLQILVAQPEDGGLYLCVANNSIRDSKLKRVRLLVQVDGGWDDWTAWTQCSVSCGYGLQHRSRSCTKPAPANGGLPCIGATDDTKSCLPMDCAVNGQWSEWLPWETCSATCGKAERVRRRYCDNPAPQHGGAPCDGVAMVTEACDVPDCPVDGNWTRWSPWQPCSVTCGDGYQERSRYCSQPEPANGGLPCHGPDTDRRQCKREECPVPGGWSGWNAWDTCSVSCGGGQRSRTRMCNNPTPAYGGRDCIGFPEQIDYCNADPCPSKLNISVKVKHRPAVIGIIVSVGAAPDPHLMAGGDGHVPQGSMEQATQALADAERNDSLPVHGGWSRWEDWGECTLPCNGGQRKRFRSCDSPTPSLGGRSCIGTNQETGECNSQPCPEGVWTGWEDWTPCSVTCGDGQMSRRRTCLQPVSGSQQCEGDSEQTQQCTLVECRAPSPVIGRGNVLGEVNGVEIEPFAVLQVVITPALSRNKATIYIADISKLVQPMGSRMRILSSLLSAFYWTTAFEKDGAANGYSLTDGNFRRESQVEFATGETVKLTHMARGVDEDGVLQADIVVTGNIPEFPVASRITLEPYTELYIQTGSEKIVGSSARLFRVDGRLLPYAWNHTIFYDGNAYGKMPFLVQKLTVRSPSASYDMNTQSLSFGMEAFIEPADPANKCPPGFVYESSGHYCQDTDECSRLSPCSHQCTNTAGGYRCSCPPGLVLESDAKTCRDIDECSVGLARCHRSQECINTEGSYKCVARCSDGYKRTDDGMTCVDINECTASSEPICDHSCLNIRGSYQCRCRFGYRLYGRSRCVDIDECQRPSPPCSHQCENTPGGYRCLCPAGTRLIGNTCENIDECVEGTDTCRAGEQCKDLAAEDGRYECVKKCPTGLDQMANGQCVDQDECARNTHRCSSSQNCKNLNGTYTCTCLRGYRTDGPGMPCVDYNECARPGLCQYECRNTDGSFQCLCPKGFRLSSNRRSCIDRDECRELNIKCGPDQSCFNQRGTYQCIDVSCPTDYIRLDSGGCGLPCSKRPDLPCLSGQYVDVIEYRTLAIPAGISSGRDLLRLAVFNQNHEQLLQTDFTITDNDLDSFDIRLERGKGVVSSVLALQGDTTYRIKVRATSYVDTRGSVQYQTTFIIYISVSEHPF